MTVRYATNVPTAFPARAVVRLPHRKVIAALVFSVLLVVIGGSL